MPSGIAVPVTGFATFCQPVRRRSQPEFPLRQETSGLQCLSYSECRRAVEQAGILDPPSVPTMGAAAGSSRCSSASCAPAPKKLLAVLSVCWSTIEEKRNQLGSPFRQRVTPPFASWNAGE
ncbi:hypothetical protein RP20_CCG005530 [Aedes albopictus]|nr:hypothetical protein RP20_CCG005530 [Aedes albopictus]